MDVKKILKENGFRFEKKFGQNFLLDNSILDNIVDNSNVDKNSVVVEIGVGAGTLTSAIAKKVKKVYGFEIDLNLKPVLKETLKDLDNVEIIFKDVMKLSMEEIEGIVKEDFTLIANLPYYITTPCIMRFIEESKKVKNIVVTIQKEVADRLVAKPKTADYGAITVSINGVADSEMIAYIGREHFLPSPNVNSACVKITMNRQKYDIEDLTAYRKVIKNSFLMRRKTLANNLMSAYNLTREKVEEILTSLNIPLNVRGEELDAIDYINLSKILK